MSRAGSKNHNGAFGSQHRLWPRLVLAAILLAFVAIKLPYLALPYYWDEAWVYAPAVKAMHANGISLMPWAIPPELSRGHPLAFHALSAAWMSVFGDSFTAMHVLPLCIAIALIASTYRLASLLGGEWLGASAALLVASNEMLLAQSGLLLPEVFLALCMLWAVISYLQRRPWLYVATCLLSLWTKETAAVLVIALIGTHAVILVGNGAWSDRKGWIRWMLVLVLPVVIASMFFLLQKWHYGWFLFPEHLDMITWSRRDIAFKAREAFTTAFETQGLQWLTLAGALLAPLVMLRQRPFLAALSAIGFIAAIKVLWGRWAVPGDAQLFVVLSCLALAIVALSRLDSTKPSRLSEPILLMGLICVGLWAFSALNFHTPRYLLPIHPFLVVGALAAWTVPGSTRRWWVIPLASVIVAVRMIASVGTDGHVGDTRLNYRDAISIHLERIRYCAARNLHDAAIKTSFTDLHYMTHPEAGYLKDARVFTRCSAELTANTSFAFVDYQSPKELPSELEEAGFVKVAYFSSGQAWGAVYERHSSEAPL
jgi:hypothetical protein